MIKKTKRSIKWVKLTKKFFPQKKQKFLGLHLIAEFWYGKIIEDTKEIKKILITAAKKANNTPLKVVIHKFQPQGITGVVLLAESHIALHSWPEFHYLSIDIYTCGNKATSEKALEYLEKEFQPKKVKVKKIKRGS